VFDRRRRKRSAQRRDLSAASALALGLPRVPGTCHGNLPQQYVTTQIRKLKM